MHKAEPYATRKRTASISLPGIFNWHLPEYVPSARVMVIAHESMTYAVNRTPAGRSKSASAG